MATQKEDQPTVELAKLDHEQNNIYLLEKATVDVQISTAHAFPRNIAKFQKAAIEMATIDADTAGSCIYRRPVGKGEDGKQNFAEGKSIRMAEIIGATYKNLRVGATIVEISDRRVIARGMAHDLESNFAATSEVIESTVKKNGQPYDERMRVVVAKAALSKARRDATFMVVPGSLCKPVEMAAREMALGKGQTLGQRRKGAMDWILKLDIDQSRVWTALGVKGIEECGIEELTTLKGLATAIRDNETSIEEAFPKPDFSAKNMANDIKSTVKKTAQAMSAATSAAVAPSEDDITADKAAIPEDELKALEYNLGIFCNTLGEVGSFEKSWDEYKDNKYFQSIVAKAKERLMGKKKSK